MFSVIIFYPKIFQLSLLQNSVLLFFLKYTDGTCKQYKHIKLVHYKYSCGGDEGKFSFCNNSKSSHHILL